MVSVTHHHVQGSFAAVPAINTSRSKGITVRHYVVRFRMILRTDWRISLEHSFSLRPVPKCVRGAVGKYLHISSFKGSVQNNEGGDSSSKAIPSESSVQISDLLHDRVENLTNSYSAQDTHVSCASESNKTVSQSQSIHKFIMKWLCLLRAGATADTKECILERPSEMDHLPEQKTTVSCKRYETLQVVKDFFLGLDATIMFLSIIFIPLYIAVNLKYGCQVSRELTPLWIVGPLIVALYMKLIRWIFALYVFIFKQTVKLNNNFPTLYSVAHQNTLPKGSLKKMCELEFGNQSPA